jgi:hypothetical protein
MSARVVRDATDRLESLGLGNTQVSDKGLKNLAGLTELRVLNVVNTRVSDEGVTRLRRELPDCIIRKD